MGGDENTFLVKFDKAISLLGSFSEKSKASFSENVSLLLDKTLDQLRNFANNANNSNNQTAHLKGQLFHTLITSGKLQNFLLDTTRISRALAVHTPVLVFSLNLIAELSSDSENFEIVYSATPELFLNIQKLVETTVVEHCDVKQAFLQLFSSLSKFKEGQRWLWASGTFNFTIQCLGDRTIFTRKSAQEIVTFVFPFLDVKQKSETLENLFNPLFEAAEQPREELSLIESDKLKPYFEVLQNCIELSLAHNREDSIGTSLVKMNAEKCLHTLITKSGNDKLPVQAGRLMVAIFAKHAAESDALRVEYETKTLSLIKHILNRGYLRSALHVLSESLFCWSNLKLADTFHVQLCRLMVIPVLLHTEEVSLCFPCYPKMISFWEDAAEGKGSTKAIANLMVSMLENNAELNELTSIPLSGFHKSMNRLNKEVSLRVFRSCMYLISCLKTNDGKRTAQLSFTPQLAIHLCKSLCDFIAIFNIKWWESPETICLPIALARLVDYSVKHDVQMTCAGLKGLKFCIEQSIHPDQALLISEPPDSTFNEIADVLQKCSVSLHWEVRDSALEVVVAMTDHSNQKYPAFRHILKHSGLLKAAFSAFNDNEAYVRASAVTVVGFASNVPELWDHLTADSDVVAECFKILQLDSEAIARRATAKSLITIFISGHFLYGGDRTCLYRNMNSAALSDLDWEVKLHALDFWQAVIDEALTQQGMLGGTFPQYTFSKEKQKIVRLDENEIRRRLEKALAELGSSGCLYVLLHLVDDCDAPVREKALRHIRKLRDLLAKHNSLDINLWPVSSFVPENASVNSVQTVSTASPQSDESATRKDREEVIEEILSVDDTKLVSDIMVWDDREVSPNPSVVHSLSPGDFVNQVHMMEVETMLHSTELSSDLHVIDFDSLLDDLQNCIHTDPFRPRPDCY